MTTTYTVGLEFRSDPKGLDRAQRSLDKVGQSAQRIKDTDPFARLNRSANATGQSLDKVGNKVVATGRQWQRGANGVSFYVDAMGRARLENGRFASSAQKAALGIGATGKAASGAAAGFGALQAAVAPLLALFSAAQTTRFVFVQTAELQTQVRSLEVLTGSLERAKQITEELQQLGAATPFTSSELIDTAKRLTAFGVAAEETVEVTRRLADVAGATGAELNGVATAYGQVVAKGRLQGEELLQFQERGVALAEELKRQYNLTGEEFQKALEKGQISAEATEFAIKKLTDAGGKYANGAIAQSDTLNGKLSTLQDSIQNLARTIGETLIPQIDFVLTKAIDATNAIQKLFSTAQLVDKTGISGQRQIELQIQAREEAVGIAQLRAGRNQFGGPRAVNPAELKKIERERYRDLLRQEGFNTGTLPVPSASAPGGADRLSEPPPLSGPRGNGGSGAGSGGGGASSEDLSAIAQLAYGPAIIAAARKEGLSPALFAGLVATESNFNAGAISSAGAIGLAQLMPGTAAELGVNPRDPVQNLAGGARYLRQQINSFGLVGGLRAYNQGPGNQQRYPGGVVPEAQQYPGKVLANAARFGFNQEQGSIFGAAAQLGGIDDAERNAQLDTDRLRTAEQQLAIDKARLEVALAESPLRKAAAEDELRRVQISQQFAGLTEQSRTAEEQAVLLVRRRAALTESELKLREDVKRIEQQELDIEKQRLQVKEQALGPIREEIGLLQARLGGTEAEFRRAQDIRRLQSGGASFTEASGLVDTRDKLREAASELERADQLAQSLEQTLAQGVGSAIRGLIDGTEDLNDALADVAQQLGDILLNRGLEQLVGGINIGGLFDGGGGAAGAAPAALNSVVFPLPGLASGGPAEMGKPFIVGEAGPELFVPGASGQVLSHDATRAALSSGVNLEEDDVFTDGETSYLGTAGAGRDGRDGRDGRSTTAMGRSSSSSSRFESTRSAIERITAATAKSEREREAQMLAADGGSGTSRIEVDSTVINSVEYVTMDQAREMAQESSKQAQGQMASRMRNNPAFRRSVGM